MTHLQFDYKNTKVKQLAEHIRDFISANEYKVGEKLPSINDLSKKFDVSRDTVFKAFLLLKEKGIVDSIHGKSYYVSNQSSNILLMLDEYTPFKEALYNSLIKKLPSTYKVDLWFHQYNEELFKTIINESYGRFSKYLVMNYDNENLSSVLNKIDKERLLFLDFGKFEKDGYSYICQNFDEQFYSALDSVKEKIKKYTRLVYVLNRRHKHPQSSKEYFKKFCTDNGLQFNFLDDVNETTVIDKNYLYIVVKQSDVVNLLKQGRKQEMTVGENFGIIAYNENPFYEVICDGISSIGVDFNLMGSLAADFILNNEKIQINLPTKIYMRNSF